MPASTEHRALTAIHIENWWQQVGDERSVELQAMWQRARAGIPPARAPSRIGFDGDAGLAGERWAYRGAAGGA